MSELQKRIRTGFLGALIFLLLLWHSYISFSILFLVISSLALWEFLEPTYKAKEIPRKLIVALHVFWFISSVLISFYFLPSTFLFIGLLSISLISLVFILFYQKNTAFDGISSVLTAYLYISLPFILLPSIVISTADYEMERILCLFLLIWCNDSMAYFVGRKLGKTKLFERISPKKTWEGFAGGVLFSVLLAYGLSFMWNFYTVYQWGFIGFLVPIAATIGDLIESMWKRSVGIKDSGNLLPGHGGFLDRFDSFIFVVPVVYLYQFLIRWL